MIPILYDSLEYEFNSNGLGRLTDCLECSVVEERNTGIYECDFTYPVTGRLFDKITLGRIIGVTHDDTGTVEPFDIVSYSKPISGVVTFHAVHISYRLTKALVTGSPVSTVAGALAAFGAAEPTNIFAYSADFEANGEMTAIGTIPRSVRALIGGVEGSFLDAFGGEIEWTKWRVIFHAQRGQARPFGIRYGVNMTDYNDKTDYTAAFNACMPYWTDGQESTVGGIVYSGVTPYNGHDAAVALDLSAAFEERPTVAQLEAEALAYMNRRQTYLPHQNISIDFANLASLGGEYANLMRCNLCDTLLVQFPAYGMSGTYKVVRTVYDVLNSRYSEMELGALSTTLAQALGVGDSARVSGGAVSSNAFFYGTCVNAQGTVAKVVSCPEFTASDLVAGTVLYVDFTAANTATNPTLNVNGTGAKPIYRYGTTRPSTSAATSWNAGSIVCLIYDGAGWNIEGWNNTTYTSMTVAEYEAGTGTTARVITPARLKGAIQYWAGATPADYITEEGTASGWKYRKWNSGYIEAWYIGSITFSAAGTSIAGWYRSVENISLPSNLVFADDAVVQVTGAYSGRIFTSGGIKTNGTQFEAQILGATAMGAGAVSGWNVYIAGQARS